MYSNSIQKKKKEDLGAMSNATSINELIDKALNSGDGGDRRIRKEMN